MRSEQDERQVELRGQRLWTRRAGRHRQTVVFVPGAGGIGLDFAPTQDLLAEQATTLIYDRAGTGQSSETDLPRRAGEVVDELHTLLEVLALPGPYLLVGHSLGGAYVQHFAQQHPAEVAGMVLLDPAHEDFDDYMPEHLKIGAPAQTPAEAPTITPELVALARDQISGYVADWPPTLREQVIDLHTRPDRLLTGFREGLNVADVFQELRRGGPRPSAPITVLTATGIDPFQAAFADHADLRRQIGGTARLGAAIAAQGQPGRQLTFPDDSHAGLPMRRPDAVAEATTQMLMNL
jgi:pimeloyl-ACP methyl ester carboxylesterase